MEPQNKQPNADKTGIKRPEPNYLMDKVWANLTTTLFLFVVALSLIVPLFFHNFVGNYFSDLLSVLKLVYDLAATTNFAPIQRALALALFAIIYLFSDKTRAYEPMQKFAQKYMGL
ncbi:hypothetical protein HYV43_06270 [Candidatus Micrarchaeota archaeon]|nr:hypothetical protein [Candidatus Micrarchaeota archaeon]